WGVGAGRHASAAVRTAAQPDGTADARTAGGCGCRTGRGQRDRSAARQPRRRRVLARSGSSNGCGRREGSHRFPRHAVTIVMRCARRLAASLVALGLVSTTARAQGPSELKPLEFLLGDWGAVGTPAGESGAFIFSLAVQDRVIVRTSYAKYPARDGQPATRHDDLMVIFAEGGALKADYFDSEQHVIHYIVSPRGPKEVVFLS